MKNLDEAKKALEKLRTGECPTWYVGVCTLLNRADAAPEDIGTTEAELLELKRVAILNDAKSALEAFRKGDGFEYCLDFMVQHLIEAKAMPIDIGATDEEIALLSTEQLFWLTSPQ